MTRRHIPWGSDYDPDDDQPQMHCVACGQACGVRWVDEGYGALEYWGSRFTHTDWQASSDCCEADVTDEEPTTEENEDD